MTSTNRTQTNRTSDWLIFAICISSFWPIGTWFSKFHCAGTISRFKTTILVCFIAHNSLFWYWSYKDHNVQNFKLFQAKYTFYWPNFRDHNSTQKQNVYPGTYSWVLAAFHKCNTKDLHSASSVKSIIHINNRSHKQICWVLYQIFTYISTTAIFKINFIFLVQQPYLSKSQYIIEAFIHFLKHDTSRLVSIQILTSCSRMDWWLLKSLLDQCP